MQMTEKKLNAKTRVNISVTKLNFPIVKRGHFAGVSFDPVHVLVDSGINRGGTVRYIINFVPYFAK